ncbi:MAG: hypothetical protein IPM29_03225 [Planctomycetes bacterium]|nr:hypothetical protein [Planctomycetota bacterium]
MRPRLDTTTLLLLAATSTLADHLAAQCPIEPVPAAPIAEIAGQIEAMAAWDPDGAGPAPVVMVLAGSSLATGVVNGRRLLLWDGQQATDLGVPPAAPTLLSIVVWNGELVVAGRANGNVWRWNGTSWLAMGVPDGDVRALVVHQGSLYACGEFATIGGTAAARIARWDGAAWTPLGLGLNGTPLCMASFGGNLWVGGDLAGAGGGQTAHLAQWNGSTWVSTPGANRPVRHLAVRAGTSQSNTFLFATGDFTSIGGVAANRVARRDLATGQWAALGAGLPLPGEHLLVRPTGATTFELFAAGSGNPHAFRWTGTLWQPLGALAVVGPRLLFFDGALYSGSRSTPGLLQRFDGTAWSPVRGDAIDGEVFAITIAGGQPVIGGAFVAVPGAVANHVARLDGTAWRPLGSGVAGGSGVFSLATMPNGDIVAGGGFTTAGGAPASNIARWNGTAWSPLGAGIAGTVRAVLAMPDGSVIAGGDFASAGGVPAANVARWNGVTWAPLSFGTNHSVRALVRLPNGDVVAGGAFDVAGGQPASRIARWDGTTWSALGAGLNDIVTALAARPDGRVIAGGRFSMAGGAAISGVAEWNGTAWSPFDIGLTDVTSLAVLPNGDVFAGKEFSPLLALRRWDGAGWSFLLTTYRLQGDPSVRALAFGETGELFVGGDFDFVSLLSGVRNSGNFARLVSPCVATAVSTGGGCTGPAGPVVMQPASRPWIGTTFRARTTGMPSGLGVAVTGLQPVSLPLLAVLPQARAGCALRASMDLLEVVVPIVDSASSVLVLPRIAALIGQQLHHQVIALAMDASFTITSALSSNALRLTIGDL